MSSSRRTFSYILLGFALTSVLLLAADWPMPSGNPQRNGWAKSEHLISRQNVGGLQLLYTYDARNMARGLHALTAPIIDGNLITYRGFKEMLIFGGASDKVFSVDADLNKLLWETKFNGGKNDAPVDGASACPGGLTAPVVMAGSSSSSMRFAARLARAPAAAAPPRRSPYYPPLSQSILPLQPTTLSELAAVYAVSSDGKLHVVNSSTGGDLIPPFKFLPQGSNVTSLNIHENKIYATTSDRCGGYQNALYGLDLLSSNREGATFPVRFGGFGGSAGTAIGSDGTVYVQVAYGEGDSLGGYHDAIVALNGSDLKVKDYFAPKGKALNKRNVGARGITPMVFSWGSRDLILAGGRDGRLYLLDSKSLGGTDHKSPLFATDVIASPDKSYAGNGFQGAFSSWLEVDSQTRWIYAPVSGPLRSSAHFPSDNGPSAAGSVVAFQLTGSSDKPVLQPVWSSREVTSPAPVVIANRIVFALSTGLSPRRAKKNGQPYSVAEAESMAGHAALYAFDALTGKELYSSRDAASVYAHSGGLAIANGRIYFSTHDNKVYCFGFLRTQPQLAERP